MQDRTPERSRLRLLVGIAAVAVVVILAAVIPSPFVIERPGPVVDTLGEVEVDGENLPIIQLDGVETHPSEGEFSLLSVSMIGSPQHPVAWLPLLSALVDPTQRIVRMEEVYPAGVSEEDREQLNESLMGSSQVQAVVAALHELGEEVDADLLVAGVSDGGPAEGVLEEEDRIVSVAGNRVSSLEEVRAGVAAAGAGAPVRVQVERDGELVEATVVPEIPEGGEDPLIGVSIASDYRLPFDAEMRLEHIGGPSAGLIFALAVYEQLTPGDLTGGLHITGTGTITDGGTVGAIGGLEQKIWGADEAGSDLMLMPLSNCPQLPDRLPSDLEIVPVETLGEAVAAVEAAATGESVTGIERCAAQ